MELEVVVPVYNEEAGLGQGVRTLHRFLEENRSRLPRWHILIADNGSTDRTPEVARGLSRELPGVDWLRIPEKGRGRALKQAWLQSQADILCYTDVDLSTDLAALLPMVDALVREGYDIAIGSRHLPGSRVGRSLKREVLSRGYNILIRALFRADFRDAQCGFKALRREVARRLLPLVEDNNWFFDTELLVLAERGGYRIKEVPVGWREDPDSRVKVLRTVLQDLRGLWRLRLHAPPVPGKEDDG